jgi:hypothetical protein
MRSLLVAVALAIVAGTAVADEPGEIAVVVASSSAMRGLERADLEAIFSLARTHDASGKALVPINGPADEPTRIAFDRAVFAMSPEQMARFWLDQRIRYGIRPPRQISDYKLAIRLAARLDGVVAYVPSTMVNETVRVVAFIRRGKVVAP